MLCPEAAVTVVAAGAEEAVAVVVAVTTRTNLHKIKIKVKTHKKGSGPHPNTLMGPQIMPVLTIIPTAVKLFSVVIHSSVAGQRSLLIQDRSQ